MHPLCCHLLVHTIEHSIRLVGCPATPGMYNIKQGDTLTNIGDKCGTTVECLQSVNSISNPNIILAGNMLQVPSSCADNSGPVPPPPPPNAAGTMLPKVCSRTWVPHMKATPGGV